MRKTNIATGGFTAVQVGRIVPADETPAPEETDTDTTPGTVVNIKGGNARVGRQAEWIPAADYPALVARLADAVGGEVFAAHRPLLAELLG